MTDGIAKRVEDYLDEEALKAWASKKWMGKVWIPELMKTLASFPENYKATCADIEAFIASQERTSTGQPNIADHLDDEAKKAWSEGKWKGKVKIGILYENLINHLPEGAKVTVEDIDRFVAEGDRRTKERNEILDEKPDGCKPMTCQCPTHRGKNDPVQPMTKYAVYFDRDQKKLVRKRHAFGDKPEVREGQFLASAEEMLFYCLSCKADANDRREQKRKQAYDEGLRGDELPRRLVWYTESAAKRKLQAKVESDLRLNEAVDFEDATAFEGVHRRAIDLERDRNKRNKGGRR